MKRNIDFHWGKDAFFPRQKSIHRGWKISLVRQLDNLCVVTDAFKVFHCFFSSEFHGICQVGFGHKDDVCWIAVIRL